MTSNVFCFASNQSKLWCGSSKPSTFVRPNQSNSDKKMFRKTFFFQVFILVLIFFNVAWKFEAFRVLGVPGVPVNPISTRAGRLCPPNNTAHQIIPAPPDLQTFLLIRPWVPEKFSTVFSGISYVPFQDLLDFPCSSNRKVALSGNPFVNFSSFDFQHVLLEICKW